MWSIEYPVITIIPRSTLYWDGSTYLGPNYGSSKSVEKFLAFVGTFDTR